MSLKVHFLQILQPRLLVEFQSQLLPEVQLTIGPELPAPADFEILIATQVTRQQLEASPKLRAFINPYTGVNEKTLQLLAEYPHVAVHNSHHPAVSTAEMAVALLLAAARWLAIRAWFSRARRCCCWGMAKLASAWPECARRWA